MILITGATGAVGRALIARLADGKIPIRAMVRDRGRAAFLTTYPRVEIAEGDFARPNTLDAALSGCEKAFLLTAPGENQSQFEADFGLAAARTKLRHIVKLSALGARPDSPSRILRAHAESELRIEESGIPFTHLRPNQFMQNFLNFRDSIIHRGEFYAPMGDGRISIVDIRDVAAVAAEVLAEYGHEDKVYEITGPESLTYAEMATRLSFQLEKTVTYVDVPPETMRSGMLQSGMSEWMADSILELYAIWKFNGASQIAGTVSTVGKKDPITFGEFARDYAPQLGLQAERPPIQKIMDTVNFDSMTPGS